MSLDRFFENPFDDYCTETACCVLENGKIKCNCKIMCKLEDKWNHTLSQFKYLDHNDYSVYTGTSGIALLKLKKDDESKQNLQEAKELLSLHRLRKKRVTFLCGDAGPLAIGALIDYKLGNKTYLDYVQRLKIMVEEVITLDSDLPNEYMYGRAGYLFAILFVNKNVSPPPFDENFVRKVLLQLLRSWCKIMSSICSKNNMVFTHLLSNLQRNKHAESSTPHTFISRNEKFRQESFNIAELFTSKHGQFVIETILLCGKDEAKAGKFKCPLMYQWHDSYYLGAAHGLSGILYLLLQAKQYLTETELNTLIRPTIDYLESLRFSTGNFPSSFGKEQDKYVQWCHGAPGFLYLFSMAHKVFGDHKYLLVALDCGEVIWNRGLLRKGYSICHGVAGNAYCFLELYQTTNDEKHLYRAYKFAEWCFEYTKQHEEHTPDRLFSLYEGIAGPMYLLLDMQNPKEAKFPGYTL